MRAGRLSVCAAILLLLLAGCGGDTSSPQVNPSGIWQGTQEIIGSGVYDIKTIVYNGQIFGISEAAGVTYAGTYAMKDGKVMVANGHSNSDTSYELYDLNNGGQAFARGVVSALVKPQESFSGAFSNAMGQEGEVVATYSKLYDKPASLDYLQSPQQTADVALDVAADGTISGSVGACTMNGSVSVPDPAHNIYQLNYELSGCSKDGAYKGLGIVGLDSNNNGYFMGFGANAGEMTVFSFGLANTPSSFTVTGTSQTTPVTTASVATPKVMAYTGKIYPTLENHNGADYSNQSMALYSYYSTFKGANFRNTYFGYLSAIGSSFANASFENATFPDYAHLPNRDSLDKEDPTIYAFGSDFTNASFKNAGPLDIYATATSFSGADFEGSYLQSDSSFTTCNFSYANFAGAKRDTNAVSGAVYTPILDGYLGNAWWFDGSRCSAASVTFCIPKVYDNGLTYQEYLAGKTDLQKDLENAEAAAKKAALSQVHFVAKVVSGWW